MGLTPPVRDSPPRYLNLGTDLAAGGHARRLLGQWCDYLGIRDPPRNTLMLLGSELVTNAVEHGDGEVSLIVTAEPEALHLAVYDDSPDLPVTGDLAPGATSGRGLFIVESLSAEWGVDPQHLGKSVWCRISF